MAFQGNGDEVNGHANAYLFSTQPLWTSSPYGVAPAPNVPTPPLHPPNNNGVAGSSASGRSRRRRKFIFCEICNQGVDRPSAMEVVRTRRPTSNSTVITFYLLQHMRSHLNWRRKYIVSRPRSQEMNHPPHSVYMPLLRPRFHKRL
ncbi:hypothetical protein FRC03_010614 [Tulasnella sp. 419]|nr:hypothetical protein FRC02_007583 [Tulasnella sp. 418]KAG8967141.1 hypothetical protein FRC03_010614 [Tulasnella sp. 419]